MRKNFVFEKDEDLYKLTNEEINKRKRRRSENLKKSDKMVIYIRPDFEEVVKKLKIIRMDEEEKKYKKRIQVIDAIKNPRFFK